MPVTYVAFEEDHGTTLLFAGDRQEIRQFSQWLAGLSGNQQRTEIVLDVSQGFEPRDGWLVELHLRTASESSAIHKPGKRIIWTMSRPACARAAKMVQALAEHDRPAHQYLEESGDIVIKVSMEEWLESVWKEPFLKLLGRS